MSNFIKKYAHALLLALLCVCFAVACGFSDYGTGSYAGQYKTTRTVDAAGNAYYNVVCFKLNYSSEKSSASYKLHSVWINIGTTDATTETDENGNVKTIDKITIEAGRTSSLSSTFGYRNDDEKFSVDNTTDGASVGSWQLLYDYSLPAAQTYFAIATKNVIRINEIAFVGEEFDSEGESTGKLTLLDAEIYAAGHRGYNASGSYAWYAKLEGSNTNTFKTEGEEVVNASKLLDKQSSFDVRRVDVAAKTYDGGSIGFTEDEMQIVNAISSLNGETGTTSTVKVDVNPVTLYLSALGVKIFGAYPFAIRIMPTLFAIGLIVLSYFVGKMLFGGKTFALLFSFVIAISGYALSLATVGGSEVFVAFFVLLSFYCLMRFIKKGISKENETLSFLNLVLGGAAFAFALACKSTALYYAPAVLAAIVIGLRRQRVAYKNRRVGLSAKYGEDDEKLKKSLADCKANYERKRTMTIVYILFGFIVLPVFILVLSFVPCFNSFAVYYGASNLFTVVNKHFFGAFGAVKASFADVLKWAVNDGAYSFGENKYVFGNVVLLWVGIAALAYLAVRVAVDAKRYIADAYETLVPYGLCCLAFLSGWLLSAIGGQAGCYGYFVPFIFLAAIIVFAVKDLYYRNAKPLFAIGKLQINAVALISAIVCVYALGVAAVSFCALVGIGINPSVFSFVFLGGNVIG